MPESSVRIAVLFPELLGTYGDGGNAVVLARRLQWRGVPACVVSVKATEPIPASCDIYVLGGGEDGPQLAALDLLVASRALGQAIAAGATVFGVCAGYQLLGEELPGAAGRPRAGLGHLPVTTRAAPVRMVGELVVKPNGDLPMLTGFENHRGLTRLGPGAESLGVVESGSGNGDGTDGAVLGHIVGTYLHGPALARNPDLADRLLAWTVGPLAELDDALSDDLRRERIGAVTRHRHRARWRQRLDPS